MDVLPITLTIAGALALINLWLSARVSRLRMSQRVSIGDGGNERVRTRMRAHANFIEYAPLFLILLGLIEMARGPETWLWAMAILFVLGRLAHAFGMDRPAPNPLRIGGMIATYTPIVVLAIYALAIPYLERSRATDPVIARAAAPSLGA
jgi:uncharacterized membrane protein YecN with MAPEG domain